MSQNSSVPLEPTKQKPELPNGFRVISTEAHGVSFWSNTGRIDVELVDGTTQSYFIKVISQETGKNMMQGEFESMKAIHTLTRFCTETVGVGDIQKHTGYPFFPMSIQRDDR